MSDLPAPPVLARTLGLTDAIVIGLGSMVGAGVFAAFAPAAAAAGSGLMIGLAIAAFVAYCNATASAQLAAEYPSSGGTYVYGRERLGDWWGFLAGWGFVVGKTASCAAMALTFAAYVAPGHLHRAVAALAVVGLVLVNLRGISRTARLSRLIVGVALASLVAVVTTSLLSGKASSSHVGAIRLDAGGLHGTLQAAGLLFFAFAGYARIATLGEEVRDPQRVIPRAILLALGLAVLLYATLGATALAVLGPHALASSKAPISDVADAVAGDWLGAVVIVGASAAALGALLALIAGVGRTTLAMSREGDLPRWLAAVHPRYQVPHRAELAIAVVVCALVLTLDLRGAIGFSSLGVLFYYFVANLAAFTQVAPSRRYPRVLQVVGAIACAVLIFTLPAPSLVAGASVFLVGIAYRALRLRQQSVR